jgi:hypothetical protein
MSPPTDSTLRSMDAAVATLTSGEQLRAAATLERIVATAPSTVTRQRSRRRLVLPTAALTLVVGSLVVQGIGGGHAAYASWTATPTAVARHDLDAAAAACRDKLGGRGSSIDMDRARLVLAERRGEIVAVLYRTDKPDLSGSCLVQLPQGSADAEVVDDGVGGSSGPALTAPARGFTQGAISSSDEASITDGAVGEGVVGVTIHAGRFTVDASVQNGRYAAWWPGSASARDLTYDLTLTDGTVIHDAQPTLPR